MESRIPNHWLLQSLPKAEFNKAIDIANERLINYSLVNTRGSVLSDEEHALFEIENETMQKVIDILELAIIELQNKKFESKEEKTTFHEICHYCFILLRALPIPKDDVDKIKHIYKLITYSYLGERWQDGRRFLIEHDDVWSVNENESKWDLRLFKKIYIAFLYLVRKSTWKDLEIASQLIVELRKEQKIFEDSYLNEIPSELIHGSAFELIGLYHLAKAIDLTAEFMINGRLLDIREHLNFHLEKAIESAESSYNIEMNLTLMLLKSMLLQMVSNSVWMVTQRVNSHVSNFVESITKSNKPVFELLYPQKAAILEEGLLDPAHKAVIVDMPTSSGKTALAEFRILQALNQFAEDGGWVAYVVPTRALVNQITNRLKRDFEPINITVEKVSGALEIDLFEENLIKHDANKFDILVTTPEKLNLLVRKGIENDLKRPLALAVIDEAHNLEDKTRGINYEILMANIKNDCPKANFLLLTPFIPNSKEIASWLDPDSPNSISIGLSWQPNDRIIGAIYPEGKAKKWKNKYQTIITERERIKVDKIIKLGEETPIDETRSNLTKTKVAVAAAKQLIDREGILVICREPDYCWKAAQDLYNMLPEIELDEEMLLIKKFIQAELGESFILSRFIDKGIGVHHAGIPEEIKFLMETLMEKQKLKVLVATTTIAQGINFPVSTIIMASYSYPFTDSMPTKDFWNLVGRAGRADQGSLGLVGIVVGANKNKLDEELQNLTSYLRKSTENLVSNLVHMVNDLEKLSEDEDLGKLIYHDVNWSQFLQYLAHMYNQSKELGNFQANAELFLRRTFGFSAIEPNKQKLLIKKVRKYAEKLDNNKAISRLSDNTGFSPEAINQALRDVKHLELDSHSWSSSNIFSGSGKLKDLMGIMLTIPEIREQMKMKNEGFTGKFLSGIITDWVSGNSLDEISEKHFGSSGESTITKCCRTIYSDIVHAASWGISSILQLPTSGIDFDKLSDEEKLDVQNLPSMIYYGVDSSEAVLMRSTNIPRSIATEMGQLYKKNNKLSNASSATAINWLAGLNDEDWNQVSKGKPLSGKEYKTIWNILNN